MHHSRVALLAVAWTTMFATSRAAAEPWTPIPTEAPTSGHEITKLASDGYCKYLHGIADSDRAFQVWPTLFVSGGLVNPSDVTGGSTAVAPEPRITAGAQYSFAGLYRGFVIEDRADAECATYRRFQELLAYIAENKEGLDETALKARAKAYDDALPAAQQKVEIARARAKEGKLPLEEVLAMESRVDAMRAAANQAKRDARAAAISPAAEDKPLKDLVAAYHETEKRAEEAEGTLRRSYAWDFNVKGGYDQVFGIGQKLPVFAVATVSVNVGYLFQGSGNDAAIEGRPVASRWSIEGAVHPAVDAVRKLHETGIAEAARLDAVTQAITTLEARERAARAIENDHAQIFADHLFFDLVQARAEQAYLRAHLVHIEKLTGEPATSFSSSANRENATSATTSARADATAKK